MPAVLSAPQRHHSALWHYARFKSTSITVFDYVQIYQRKMPVTSLDRPIVPTHLKFLQFCLNGASAREKRLQNGVVENQARQQFLAVLKQASITGLPGQNLAVIDFTCGTCGYVGLSGKNMKIGGEPAHEVLLKALDEDVMANSRLAMSMTAPKGGLQHLRSIDAFNMTLGECIVASHPGSYKVPQPMSGGVSAVQIRFAADDAAAPNRKDVTMTFTHGNKSDCGRMRQAMLLLRPRGNGVADVDSLFLSVFGLQQPEALLPPLPDDVALFKANKRRKKQVDALLNDSNKNDETLVISDEDHSETDETDVVYDSAYDSPDIYSARE